MSKIQGLDDLDLMFPTAPKEIEDKKPKEDSKKQELKQQEPPKKKEQEKTATPKPAPKEQAEKKAKNQKQEKKEAEVKVEQVQEQTEQNDGFFVVPKRAKFVETHSQENIWLENELKAELDKIFEGKPKGFKTQFYNAALWFAVKKYKDQGK
ncbi:hypothetical protein CTH_10049 (plasmid) [Carboxydocella thermautotrophica]|nr:hypothetical protein CTH_10049 [Carboxydocella thermautotrophica]